MMKGEHNDSKKYSELIVVRELLKRQNSMLGQSLIGLEHLLYLQKSINRLGIDDIKKILVEKLPDILFIRFFSLFLFDKDKNQLVLACHNKSYLPENLTFGLDESPVMRDAVERATYILEPDFRKSKYFSGKSGLHFENEFFLCIPLMIENEIIGVLNLNDSKKGFYTVSELDFVLTVAEFLSMALSNALLFGKVERLSVTDGLTGLYNHKQMQLILNSEFGRSVRYRAPLAIIIFDVDHFKKVNDTYGHQKGDEVLTTLAALLKKFCRAHDYPARYGGEEFVLILPETGLQGAALIAERVREAVSRIPFLYKGAEWHVTISCGVAELDHERMKNEKMLVLTADKALYKAKHSGRNRTILGEFDANP